MAALCCSICKAAEPEDVPDFKQVSHRSENTALEIKHCCKEVLQFSRPTDVPVCTQLPLISKSCQKEQSRGVKAAYPQTRQLSMAI